ncbi:hypothetical protein HMPREF0669_02018 (plasmid) [Prevotella sp. oral taxon 299 str. F0039]|nr:hypothetical protein HMPREF0669_02018 [Prevotella sp. oral taxon 299 str. F0039]
MFYFQASKHFFILVIIIFLNVNIMSFISIELSTLPLYFRFLSFYNFLLSYYIYAFRK